jgi:lauroyl/myristoyl acyltransferase
MTDSETSTDIRIAESDPWYRGPRPAWIDDTLSLDFAASRDRFRAQRLADLRRNNPAVVADVEHRIETGMRDFGVDPTSDKVQRTLEYLGSRLADLTSMRWDPARWQRIDMSSWNALELDSPSVGAIVLTPHFGPVELLVQALRQQHATTVVVSHGARFHPDQERARSRSDDGAFEILRAPQPGLGLALAKRLAAGRLVVFPAEFSSRGDDRFMPVHVLGQPVNVPSFPVRLAESRRVPLAWAAIDDTPSGWNVNATAATAALSDWCQERFDSLTADVRSAPHKWEGWVASSFMIPT